MEKVTRVSTKSRVLGTSFFELILGEVGRDDLKKWSQTEKQSKFVVLP